MKKYTVNVHYDYCATVEVIAESGDEAITLAREEAQNIPSNELEYCDEIDACITDVEDI